MNRRREDFWMRGDLRSLVNRRCDQHPRSLGYMYCAEIILESLGYVVNPAFGTLLGLHRDGGLIPHDTDIDINIYQSEKREKFLKEEIEKVFKELGFVCVLKDTNQLAFYKEDCVIVDICFFSRKEDGSYECDHQVKKFVLSKEAVENDETFLEEVYGDWKTPKSKQETYLK